MFLSGTDWKMATNHVITFPPLFFSVSVIAISTLSIACPFSRQVASSEYVFMHFKWSRILMKFEKICVNFPVIQSLADKSVLLWGE